MGMVETVGSGTARHYMLSAKVYALTQNEAGYAMQRGFSTITEHGMILEHLEHYGKITRANVAELCKCNNNHAS